MPREAQADFGSFPNKEIIDAQNVWAKNIDERIGQAWIAYAGEELRDVATGVMDLVHTVDPRSRVFAVADQGIAVDVGHWHSSLPRDNVFGHLSQMIVFLV